VLQLQLGRATSDSSPGGPGAGPAALRQVSLTRLEVTSLRENPTWRWLRRFMLVLGAGLVALRFYRYVPTRDRLFSARGLLAALGSLALAGIVFGCIVSVPLKADIYALLTGGRTLPASTVELEALLTSAFPLGGFSLFTVLHAVLFAVAGTTLGLAAAPSRSGVWASHGSGADEVSTHGEVLSDLLLLGAVTETLQLFVPGRGPGIYDMLVDWSGVAVAAVLVLLLRRSQRVGLLLEK